MKSKAEKEFTAKYPHANVRLTGRQYMAFAVYAGDYLCAEGATRQEAFAAALSYESNDFITPEPSERATEVVTEEEAMTQTKPAEHALPWQFYQHSVSKLWSVRTADHERIAFDLDESTARLIVTAVNSHAELVEALKEVQSDINRAFRNDVVWPDTVSMIEAALKKAGAL